MGNGAVGHPLRIEALAHQNILVSDFETLMLWEIGEKRNEAKCVIHIFESILERWVPFSDNMAESVSWSLLLQFFSELELLLTLTTDSGLVERHWLHHLLLVHHVWWEVVVLTLVAHWHWRGSHVLVWIESTEATRKSSQLSEVGDLDH